MTQEPYVLLVEDNPGDARLVVELLEGGHAEARPRLQWVQTLESAVKHLDAHPSCALILLDLGLPDSQGLQTLQSLVRPPRSASIIVLTELGTEAVGSEAVAAGAQDYLVKGRLGVTMLKGLVAYAMGRYRMATNRPKH